MQFKPTTLQNTLELVHHWYTYANTIQIESDKAWHLRMQKLSQLPRDKKLLFELLNGLFRTNHNKKLALFVDDLLKIYQPGDYFTPSQKAFFWLFKHSTKHTPDFSVALIKDYVKQECRHFLTNSASLDEYLDTKTVQEIPVHSTLLMRDALNEYEANKNVEKYIQLLAKESIESLSINIFAIHPRFNFICANSCLQSLENRLSVLFGKALQYQKKSGTKRLYLEIPNKQFASLIIDAFEHVILKKEFEKLNIGLGFCIDNMDIMPLLERLNTIAFKRDKDNIKAIEIKLLKTRNNKKVIRHFYEILYYVFEQKHKPLALNLLLNSHNLFDMGLAYTLAYENQQLQRLHLQMDKGMNLSYRSAIATLTQSVWVNSPTVDFDEFEKSIAYLLSRLNQYSKRNNQYKIQKQSFIKYSKEELLSCKSTHYGIENSAVISSCCKELVFVSQLCDRVKLVQHIIQKIALCEKTQKFLSFEIFVEEGDDLLDELKTILTKTMQDFFSCSFGVGNFSSAKRTASDKNGCIMISSSSLEVLIKLRATHNLADATKRCKNIKELFDCTIYTLNKQEHRSLLQSLKR